MNTNEPAKIDLSVLRVFAGFVILATGLAALVTQNQDPMWERVLVSLTALVPLVASYFSKKVRDNFDYALYPMYIIFPIWEAHLAYINRFNTEEAISAIMILIIMGLVAYRHYYHLILEVSFVLVLDVVVLMLIGGLGEERWVILTYLLISAGLAMIMGGAKQRMLNLLIAGRERLKAISSAASDAIVGVDGKDKIAYWNLSANKMFGYEEEEIVGQPIGTILGDKYTNQGGLAEGSRKDGSKVALEYTAGIWEGPAGKTTTYVIRDVTEKRRSEQVERARNAELERLNKILIGRELRMRELKHKVQEYEAKLKKASL